MWATSAGATRMTNYSRVVHSLVQFYGTIAPSRARTDKAEVGSSNLPRSTVLTERMYHDFAHPKSTQEG